MKFSKVVLGASALLCVVTSCGSKQETGQVSAQPYPTAVIAGQAVELSTVFPANIKGQDVVEIRPRIDGFILQMFIDEGSVVKKGQSLFKIDSPTAEQSLRTAEAAVASAKAQVNTAKTNVDRTKPLVEKNIVSQIQLTQAEDSYQTALASLAQAEASLANAKATMSWTNVLAPVDGLVGEIPYRVGSLVSSSNALTTLTNVGSVYAYFSMNEKSLSAFLSSLEGATQAEKIKNLPPVTLTLADGTVYEHTGRIETIAGSVNSNTGTANFRAEFPNPNGILKSGTSGKVTIPKHLDDAFLVPQKATLSLQDKVLIYKVQGDSVVQIGITVESTPDGRSYVVTSGLNAGDKVVTDGVATLSHGKKVTVK